MKALKVALEIFLLVVLVCPVIEVVSQAHGRRERFAVRSDKGLLNHGHQEKPCAVCPGQGKCVPKVQCPAHTRPDSKNPTCHLDGKALGVCCYTGHHHGERKTRAAPSISPQDMKSAHHRSQRKLDRWMAKSEKLASHKDTVVNVTSPYFAHHLSVMTTDRQAEDLARGGLLNLFAAQELKARQALSDDDIALGLTGHANGPFCPSPRVCPDPPSRYRSFNGDCVNVASPSWGAVHTAFQRLLPPDYSDGIWAMRVSSLGVPLPSARAVSAALVLDGSHPSPTHNLIFMQFGQFIAHDTSAGEIFSIAKGSPISCCSGTGEEFLPPELQHDACAPIAADQTDPFFSQFRLLCLNFVRSQLAPASDCSVGYANQMNGATHLADLSHLYGTSDEKINQLKGAGGLLKTFNDYGRELPPLTERKECLNAKEGAACFESGDSHGNQIISLTVFHTVWTREHNRIARALTRINPEWNEERIFLEARRITQAEFQHIIYNEWLPLLLGPELMASFGLLPSSGYSSSYDHLVNPSLTAEFSTAAMRFGHSVVDGKITIPRVRTGEVYESVFIPEVMFQPARLRIRPFLDRMIVGLTWQPMQSVDPFVTEGLTRYLFHGGNPFGIDLAAINIQRGRDYGVRSYNQYRRLVGLDQYEDFKQFSPNAAQRLSSVYESPEDIDLWVGGLMEATMEEAVVGPTFGNILADQFSKMKKGDRYFYEHGPDTNPGAFTPGQLAEIKKVTMSRILCDNSDGIELLTQPPHAFVRPDLPGNDPVPCDSLLIPVVDISRFKDAF